MFSCRFLIVFYSSLYSYIFIWWYGISLAFILSPLLLSCFSILQLLHIYLFLIAWTYSFILSNPSFSLQYVFNSHIYIVSSLHLLLFPNDFTLFMLINLIYLYLLLYQILSSLVTDYCDSCSTVAFTGIGISKLTLQ